MADSKFKDDQNLNELKWPLPENQFEEKIACLMPHHFICGILLSVYFFIYFLTFCAFLQYASSAKIII